MVNKLIVGTIIILAAFGIHKAFRIQLGSQAGLLAQTKSAYVGYGVSSNKCVCALEFQDARLKSEQAKKKLDQFTKANRKTSLSASEHANIERMLIDARSASAIADEAAAKLKKCLKSELSKDKAAIKLIDQCVSNKPADKKVWEGIKKEIGI